jgi:uncharacterized Fe-S cluster-containing MiaB family protein
MYHLIYVSHASTKLIEDELFQILESSREKNKEKSVTGMLVYLQGKFIQVLEGKKSIVEELFEEIKKDPRHKKVIKILEGNTPERIFKNWSMGFKKINLNQFTEISGYTDPEVFFSEDRITEESPAALIFLAHFYKKNFVDYPEETSK